MADVQSGPAAVVRNLRALLGGKNDEWRLVVMDRYYTSVSLLIQLLADKFYAIGTVMTNRLGFPKTLIDKRKTRPRSVPRGSFVYAASKHIPSMSAVVWWDNKPVHMLCTGAAMTLDVVSRREKSGVLAQVPCPRVVRNYTEHMGGVDVHDQYRLQR
jgi:hypothetical protein